MMPRRIARLCAAVELREYPHRGSEQRTGLLPQPLFGNERRLEPPAPRKLPEYPSLCVLLDRRTRCAGSLKLWSTQRNRTTHQRPIEHVDPDDRLVVFVAVIVPRRWAWMMSPRNASQARLRCWCSAFFREIVRLALGL